MVGPDRSLKGGIVTVVDGYFNAGLAQRCAALTYQGTGVGSNLLSKSLAFARILPTYKRALADFDIVHLHISARGSFKRKALMAAMAHKAGKKVILHEHSGEFARDFVAGDDAYRARVKDAFNGADCVVVLSEEWRDYFAENVMHDAGKLSVLHNGVPIPKKPCSPCSHQDVLFLGRLDANKSPDVLLRASKNMLEAHPNAKLLFGGDGYPERYEALARELGIAERCEFLGWITGEDKEKLFARAGVYCLPSKNEGMPMSVLEAMARGVPTIATNVGGVPQVIEDGVNGYLMPVDDEERLSELLCGLMDDPAARDEIGAAGRETIERGFSIERNISNLISLYRDLLSQGENGI